MSKLSTAATFAAILAAGAPAAVAQNSATPQTRTETTGVVSQTGIQPDQIRASKMLGSTVYDMQKPEHWQGPGRRPRQVRYG